MEIIISDKYKYSREELLECLQNFESEGEMLGDGARNKIKIFRIHGRQINIKSFKIPNSINKIVYRFFRKSKAERSFYYAHHLISKKIGTPFPVAYSEENQGFQFGKSYYISEQVSYDLTYRELVENPNFPDHEKILRAFTRFTFMLHEERILFLDHSPGNTLIQLNNGNYKFFLVDLNRMKFKNLDFETRMRNFSRLTPKKEMVSVMASEYSKLIKKPEEEVFERMWFYTQDFQKKYHRKRELKQKLKGRKS